MMNQPDAIRQDLKKYADAEKAAFLPKFFQAFPGGYGEGDQFIGVAVPNQRKVARKYCKSVSLNDLDMLIRDPVHECRAPCCATP